MSKEIKGEFQEFIFSNNVIYAAASWAVGLATKEFIQQLIEKSLIPILLALGAKIMSNKRKSWIKQNLSVLSYIGNLLWIFIVWMLTIFLTFVILEYLFNRQIVGLKSTVKETDKVSFAKAKLSVENKEFAEKDKELNDIIEEEIKYNPKSNYVLTNVD
jgi:large-conductance mechanosensitive channel